MKHVIRRTRDPGVLPPTLPDQLEHVVHARQDVVHENHRIKDLALGIPQFVQGHHGRVPDLGEVFDPMVERSSGSHRGTDDDPHPDHPSERVKDPEERLGLVVGSVLVDRDEDVVVPQHAGRPEHGREQVRNDVKRVVEVDGKKVLVLLGHQVALLVFVPPVRAQRVRVSFIEVGSLGVHQIGRMRVWYHSPASESEPPFTGVVRLVTDERFITFVHLLCVLLLRLSEAFLGMVRGERGDDLEHSVALGEGAVGRPHRPHQPVEPQKGCDDPVDSRQRRAPAQP